MSWSHILHSQVRLMTSYMCTEVLMIKAVIFKNIIKVVKITEEFHANAERKPGSLEHISRESFFFAYTGAPSGAQTQVEHLI